MTLTRVSDVMTALLFLMLVNTFRCRKEILIAHSSKAARRVQAADVTRFTDADLGCGIDMVHLYGLHDRMGHACNDDVKVLPT